MSDSGFSKFNLSKETSKALDSKGWVEPTEIQRETISAALTGRDIIGQARTGSGKTAAFGIPIIEGCTSTGHPQAIVLCPTRELAVQVAEEMNWLQGDKGLKIRTIYGGTDIERQAKELASGTDVIVGTPGRVIDMTKRSHLDLSGISTFCLDEADRMLDMGFFPDCLLYTSPSPRDKRQSRMPSSA